MRQDVRVQLAEELGARSRAWLGVLGVGVLDAMLEEIPRAVHTLTAELCGENDHVAAEAALTIMTVLSPSGSSPELSWWRTPLGRAVARASGADEQTVTRSQAAAMLGVSDGTVAQWGHRGTLERDENGRIKRASVFARLARVMSSQQDTQMTEG